VISKRCQRGTLVLSEEGFVFFRKRPSHLGPDFLIVIDN